MRQIIPIVSILMSAAFLLAAGGLHGLLLPIRGQIENFTAFQIGWIGTFYALGFTLGCLYAPYLVRRVGHVRTFSALCAMLATIILLNALIVHPMAWMLLRAFTGFGFAGCYMVSESWLNERVDNASRGTIFSYYMVITQIALMSGQYMLVFSSPEKDTLFMLGAIFYALAVLPTAVSKAQSPAPLTEVTLDLKTLFNNSPVAVVGAVFSGIITSSWGTFAPVFGQEAGFDSAGIANLVIIAVIGSVTLQFPIGKLSDRIDRRIVMVGAGIASSAIGLLAFWLSEIDPHSIAFFTTILFYGAGVFVIYSLNVAHANDHANPEDFVQTAGGLLIIYGAGTMIGPLFTAQFMNFFGFSALFLATALAHALYAGYAFYRIFQREAPKHDEQVDYQSSPMAKVHTPETYAIDPRSDAEYNEAHAHDDVH